MGLGGTPSLGMRTRHALGNMQAHLLIMGLEPIRRGPMVVAIGSELVEDTRDTARRATANVIDMPEVVIAPPMADPVLQKMILNVRGDVNTSAYVSSSVVPKGENARVPEKHEKPKGWNVAHPKRTCEGR